MFVDKAKIYVKGGDGGDGLVAFRREKYVPEGGPAGGDGGRGGDVIFRVDEGLRTLMDFRYQRHFKADRGVKGRNKSQHGANAEHMIVRIPPGTILIDDDTQEIIADMTRHGQQVVVAKGGRGGRGNVRFATANNPAPELAENGEEGQERYIVMELKVMADVGLVGFPSVGKSTLLSVVSAAQPKIGAYHFTTITPNLGVVAAGDGRSFVMADLPGLIEGASEGVGLGHEFLRHVERTRIIIHVVDMSGSEGRDPFEDWVLINDELKQYNANLLDRPQIVAANKMDMPESEENLISFRERIAEIRPDLEIMPISSLTRQGIQELLYRAADLLDSIPVAPVVEEVAETVERKVYKLEAEADDSFTITRDNEAFVVNSPRIEKMLKRMQLSTHDAILKLARTLRHMGVDAELRKRGAVEGTIVRIGDFEFEFVENSSYY
ncbi:MULTISPECIES: GTPase ObgE [unclassified Paenibacillus]|uniref:GTPase ObgE n=1 Tax=unclassified Paenibacillus TaxID=185978 RepID=UPI00240510C6|nr:MULTISPECIES: GTPase ObgE [unclassified Paenibacillus]MDF9843994.1 GTP-binding protein [Paenibacillus sp. PastF-2]MDF9850599.1 GTP-binding protein [Paenibacillus sp. PastM-2]MDF9857251.1 GTP-binding protein [Paenibacillus sp. PastF-1]MDH6482449.1 GTP-binding protein [Paenibacillus sp. PastH-2]MDH6509948.1 GTP-binding protein [Paenibacillus sp. PastM-3]